MLVSSNIFEGFHERVTMFNQYHNFLECIETDFLAVWLVYGNLQVNSIVNDSFVEVRKVVETVEVLNSVLIWLLSHL